MTEESPTVFVIDADLSFAEHICRAVEAVGMVGIPFETSRDFLASGPAGRPNCALVNMRLPGMGVRCCSVNCWRSGVPSRSS